MWVAVGEEKKLNTPTKISTVIIGFITVLMIFVAGGMFAADSLNATNTVMDDGSGFSSENFTHFHDDYWSRTLNVTETMDDTLQQTNSSGLGVLELGWDFLQNTWSLLINIFTLGGVLKDFTSEIGTALSIPPEITFMLLTIIVVVIFIAVLNSLRRWNN